MPAAPQQAPSARNITRSSWSTPSGRHTVLQPGAAVARRADRSDSLATARPRRARSAKLCGSSGEYSASASKGSYSGGIRVSPLVIVLITRVSGSIVAQQVRSALTWRPTTRIAAACSSATPRPAAARAAMSRRARWARSSHIRPV